MISIVIPSYRCSQSLVELHKRLVAVLKSLNHDYEIIMVNDASPDNDWEVIAQLASKDKKVIGIDLSRNFGQHYAITAGLENASGNWVIVMDGDLQDQPEEIPKMFEKTNEGYEVILGRRHSRKDNIFKKASSKIFSWIFSYFLETKIDNTIANFGVYHKKVIQAVLSLKEKDRSFPAIVNWLGFKKTTVDIEHAERFAGTTSYSFAKSLGFALDVIISQSNKPLKLSIRFGLFMSFVSFLFIIYLGYKYFVLGIAIEGWTSLMVSLFFIAGLLFANLGIIGLYIGKSFDEAKKRPLYVIREKLNKD